MSRGNAGDGRIVGAILWTVLALPAPGASAEPELKKWIQDLRGADRDARAQAAARIGACGVKCRSAVPALVDMFRKGGAEDRKFAIDSLAGIVRGISVEGATAVVLGRPASRLADEPECREILGVVRPVAVEPIEGKDLDALDVPLAAVQLLGRCGGKAEVPTLLPMIQEDSLRQVVAMDALASMGPDAAAALPALEALSGKLNPGLQWRLELTLKAIRPKKN